MHARIEHLLSVRDAEPVDREMAAHIGQCPACAAQLQRLSGIREQLRALPQLEPPQLEPSSGSWARIQQHMGRSGAMDWRRPMGRAAAAAAVVILAIVAAVAVYQGGPSSEATLRAQGARSAQADAPSEQAGHESAARTAQSPGGSPGRGVAAVAPAQTPRTAADAHSAADVAVADLVAQSQALDRLLQILPERPRVERVSTAATLDTIEQRIQWLDFQLSDGPDGTLSERQAQQLWHERVDLMDSLVKVRYAQTHRSSF